MIKNFLLLNHP